MLTAVLLDLISNVAIFALATVLFSRIVRLRERLPAHAYPMLLGGVLGLTAFVGMLFPIKIAEGVLFDGRAVALVLSGLLAGPVAAAVALVPPLCYRAFIGGNGMTAGFVSLFLAALLGTVFHLRCRKSRRDISIWDLAIVSFLLPLTTYVAFLFLPSLVLTQSVMARMGIPVMVAYPLGTMLLGMLFLDEERRLKTLSELRAKHALLDALHLEIPAMLFQLKTGSPGQSPQLTFVSPSAARLVGVEPSSALEDPSRLLQRLEPGSRERFLGALEAAEEDGMLEGAHYRSRSTDGRSRWLWVSANAREEGGERLWNAIALDVTDQKEAEQRLSELAQIVRDVGTPIIQLDRSFMVTYFNEAAERLYGYRAEEVIGRPGAVFRPPECVDRMSTFLAGLQQNASHASVETLALHKSGRRIPVRLDVSPLKTASGALLGWVSMTHDRTEELRVARELEALATTDTLTGLLNRRAFEDAGTAEIERARRYRHELGVILLDIDHFKRINDTYGHAGGDEVLRFFARKLRALIRSEIDVVARIGGEEFVILVPETSLAGTHNLAERIRGLIALEPLMVGDQVCGVTSSLGVSAWHSSETSIEAALKRADEALYESKRLGRDRVSALPAPASPVRLVSDTMDIC